jgi:hypothetical protein
MGLSIKKLKAYTTIVWQKAAFVKEITTIKRGLTEFAARNILSNPRYGRCSTLDVRPGIAYRGSRIG